MKFKCRKAAPSEVCILLPAINCINFGWSSFSNTTPYALSFTLSSTSTFAYPYIIFAKNKRNMCKSINRTRSYWAQSESRSYCHSLVVLCLDPYPGSRQASPPTLFRATFLSCARRGWGRSGLEDFSRISTRFRRNPWLWNHRLCTTTPSWCQDGQ